MIDQKVVLITGGTGGIGSALAKLCLEEGWFPAILGRKNSTRLEAMKEELGVSFAREWDASDQAEIKRIADELFAETGRIDYLVNLAGIVLSKPFMEINREDAIEEYEVNVMGSIYATQAVAPYMKEGGSIVNVSSLRGVETLASQRSITYSMTKAAVRSLTCALAKELAPNIRVNAVAPGFTKTNMSDSWGESTIINANENNYYKRPAQAEEIAEFIRFLLSNKSSYMTGQTLLIDGGYSLHGK